MPQTPTQTQLDQIFDEACIAFYRSGTSVAILQDPVDSIAAVIVAVWSLEAEIEQDPYFWDRKLQVAVKMAKRMPRAEVGMDLIGLVADKLLV